MTATLPDDPYHALGLTKDATSAAIKTAYRKLVLKHHPDKVQDESLKTAAADLFHKIQSAWETIGDDDKRSRYDAQARLATLRKEALDMRTPARDMRPSQPQAYREEPRSYDYRDSPRSASYRTEEIKPFDTDYFDKPRRDYDVHERTRPSAPRSKPVRQDPKDMERARRRESGRQSSRATARDRDYKYMQAEVESDSDSDRHRRSPRERDSHRYQDSPRKYEESRYYDERTNSKLADARDHIQKQMRRSPTRTSSRDEDVVRDRDGRPIAFRRGSGRPKQLSRDDLDSQPRRRDSSELEEPRRPPNLASTKSAPHDIRLPYEKTRAASVQHTKAEMADFMPSPVKRADSMPLQARSKPVRQSTLRQTQTSDDLDKRRPAGRSREYLDDHEVPTPDGYVIRKPSRTQSPETYSRRRTSPEEPYRSTRSRDQPSRRELSPEPDRYRGTDRGSSRRDHSVDATYSRPRAQSPGAYRSARPQPPPLNTRSSNATYTTYSPVSGGGVEQLTSATRPKLSRGDSGRKDSYLYGEVRPSSYSIPPPENVRYRDVRPEYKVQTSRRPSEVRPSPGYTRGSSFQAMPTSA